MRPPVAFAKPSRKAIPSRAGSRMPACAAMMAEVDRTGGSAEMAWLDFS
jgi:hypothetical protein